MPLPYAQNKKHILKWRETHRKEYNLLSKSHQNWRKIRLEFCRILIDDAVFIPI
jgi:hypothetical protein